MIKKITLCILAFLLVLGMAACSPGRGLGGREKVGDVVGMDETTNAGVQNVGTQNAGNGVENDMQPWNIAENGSAEQYVYSGVIIDFAEYGSDVVVHDIAGRGEQLYVLLEVREWGPEPEDPVQKQEYTSYYQVFTCLADGSGKAVSGKIDLPGDGGYVSTMQLSDDGCVAALFYSDTGDSVSLIFQDGFQDNHWEKEIASGGYLFLGEDGILILARSGEGRVADTYDFQGEFTGSMELEEEAFRSFENCFYTSDGRFFLVKTDSVGKPYGEFYDPATGREERTGWSREEFSAVMAGLPEETEIISEISRYDYLEDYMRVCGREYVDTDQGKCSFQSEDFVSALEFAMALSEYAESSGCEENSYSSQYLEDRALLQPVTIRYIPQLAQQIYGCMGEEIAYVGYPSETREGSCIRMGGMCFALSDKSANLEGAWEFVRCFLTEDFQRDRLYETEGSGLPARRDIFYEKAQTAATQESYCFVNDEYIPLPPMTQGQIDKATGFIEGLYNAAFEDEVIMGIIREEAESFFRGQKTAEDVAGLIQNRVQLYLDEGR